MRLSLVDEHSEENEAVAELILSERQRAEGLNEAMIYATKGSLPAVYNFRVLVTFDERPRT